MKRAIIEALWAKNPALTIEQVRRATGAPSAVVKRVFRHLVATGKLAREKRMPADFLRAV